ncbi:MAG: 3-phosphoserine/phosphohydroxythreonine transaminase [Bacteroidetes bacterium SW_11_45_7]|nr:MAG: 3-phosphoserine/phosphohydroxythreonine transaminase [Bacteroidetes bacterium SW_11_45_7]
MKKHIFNAGPAILPDEVLQRASESVVEYDGSDMSLLTISHRGKEFEKILEESRQMVKDLLGVPNEYDVLFLQGGASMQFCMVPYNLLDDGKTASYIDTGSWANKAIKEAKFFGNVNVVASSEDDGYTYIPKDYTISDKSQYLHITTNNTIYGTQFHQEPNTYIPLVADMSSDLFSRRIDPSEFDLIYAGAQKNLGPAGVTLVITKKDIGNRVKRDIPTMLDYQTHIDKGSAFNTPPVFAIYVCYLTLQWLRDNGGIKAMEETNKQKAATLYEEIDKNPLFKGVAHQDDRSYMNATFVINEPGLEATFLKEAEQEGFSGLKGHRSVGGFRASLYNALPIEEVTALGRFILDSCYLRVGLLEVIVPLFFQALLKIQYSINGSHISK